MDQRPERCSECQIPRLDEALSNTPAGELLRRVYDLEFALDAGFTLTLSDITCEEFDALRSVRYERDKYREEKQKESEWRNGLTQSKGKPGSR